MTDPNLHHQENLRLLTRTIDLAGVRGRPVQLDVPELTEEVLERGLVSVLLTFEGNEWQALPCSLGRGTLMHYRLEVGRLTLESGGEGNHFGSTAALRLAIVAPESVAKQAYWVQQKG